MYKPASRFMVPFNVLRDSGYWEVICDPGHGGDDRHNKGPHGYIEADGVLTISKSFEARLESYNNVNVTLTRYKDTTMSLTPRGLMAEGKDLFISHHTNADSSGLARGVEVFYSVDLPEDCILAEKICQAIATRYGVPNRGAKLRAGTNDPSEDFYTVIDKAQDSGCPHVFLVEFLFHSNLEDERILLDEQNLIDMGIIEADVIANHFGLVLKDKELSDYEKEKIEARQFAMENGISDGTRPTDPMTREEYWVMEYRKSVDT